MKVSIGQIADGRTGTVQTIERMFQLIELGQTDPALIQIVRRSIGTTKFSREKRIISKAVKGVLRYVRILEDPVRHEFIQSVGVTLETGRADCDDLVILVGSALEHMGFEVDVVVGSQTSDGAFTHVWLWTWLPIAERWMPVDPRGMLEFGWPVGRELKRLTARETFSYDEESKTIQAGRSSMRGGLGRAQRSNARRRRRMGLFIEAQPLPPRSAAIGPVVIPHISVRQFKPSVVRDFRPRMRAVQGQPGRVARAFNMRQARRLGNQQFPFPESRGVLVGDATATGRAPAGTTIVEGKTTTIVTEEQMIEKQEKRASLIQTLTIVALGTGILANISR